MFFYFVRKSVFIDYPLSSGGAVNSNFFAVFQSPRCFFRSDNARNSKFSGNNRGMTRPTALVGYNGGGDLHNRLPVGIGNLSYKNLSLPKLSDIFRAFYNPRLAGG